MSSRSPYLGSLVCLLCVCLFGSTLARFFNYDCVKKNQACNSCSSRHRSLCEDCDFNVMEIRAGNDRVCTDKPNTIKNCRKEKLEKGKHICEECDYGYYRKENKCFKGTIKHCVLYDHRTPKMLCDRCKNNRIFFRRTGKCERLPKDKVIPNCMVHKLQIKYSAKASWYKPYCHTCKEGYATTINSDGKCVKPCIPGCYYCHNNRCVWCDTKKMFYPTPSGSCRKFPLPKGHSNIYLEKGVNEDDKPTTWASFSKMLKLGFY